jgi:hypothetical protein
MPISTIFHLQDFPFPYRSKLRIIPERYSNPIPLLNAGLLEPASQAIRITVQRIVGKAYMLVMRYHTTIKLFTRVGWKLKRDLTYALRSPNCWTTDAKCCGTVCSRRAGCRITSQYNCILQSSRTYLGWSSAVCLCNESSSRNTTGYARS